MAMVASMTVNKTVSQVSHLSHYVASRIQGAMFLYINHTRCPLYTDKYIKHTGTGLRINNIQRDKTPLPSEPGTGWHRLLIATAQALERNVTLEHAETSPRDKEAQLYLLAALRNTLLFQNTRHSNTPFISLLTCTLTLVSLQDF